MYLSVSGLTSDFVCENPEKGSAENHVNVRFLVVLVLKS